MSGASPLWNPAVPRPRRTREVHRYAEDTAVPIARSRGEIDRLLRQWGAVGISWSDDFRHDVATLRFVWPKDGRRYMARFSVRLPSREALSLKAVDNRSGQVSERKLERLMDDRGRREHRVLGLWLRAALNAVDTGIVTAEELFLPFLVGADDRTVAEVALPRLPSLADHSAARLLPETGNPE